MIQPKLTLKKFTAGMAAMVTVLAAAGSMFLGAPAAFAGTGIGVTPNFPSSVTVGQNNIAVSLDISNNSSADVGSLTIDSIYLTPQCGDSSIPCTMPDPGVFTVSASGTGSGACAANTFTISQVDASTGRVQFVPNATIDLALGATCTINFSVNAVKAPTLDASGATGMQTAQSAQVSAHDTATGNLPASGTGADITTVNKADSSVVTQVRDVNNADITNSTTTIGSVIHDHATVNGTGSTTPTGTVDFAMFDNNNCSGTSGATQSGVPLVNGSADSATTTLTSTGFSYLVHYNGDATYNPSNGVCEPVNSSKLTPNVFTQIAREDNFEVTNSTVTPGTLIHDLAIVSGSGPTPTGTVDFSVFNNTNCSGSAGQTMSGVPIIGTDANATSIPAQIGGISFIAHYNGDTNYNPANGICEVVFVSQLTPTVTTAIHDPSHHIITTANSGDTVHDSATVTGSGTTPTGDVVFAFFNNGTCSNAPIATSSTMSLAAGTVDATGFAQGPLTAGSYSFMASYGGNTTYTGASSACEPLTVSKSQPTISTTLSTTTPVNVNTAVHDSATISGATSNAGGTVIYNVYSGTLCSGTPVFTNTQNVTNGTVPNSGDFTPTTAGTYNWQAVYSGDANNSGATSACGTETLTVVQPIIQSCSPGYWKQPQHFGSYPTGIYPNTLFKDVFGVDAFPGKTLLDVLSTGGGGLTALGRQIVNAYLNAATLSNYPLTTAQVISAFQSAYSSHNYSSLQSQLEGYGDNCPLGRNPGPAGPTSTTQSSTDMSVDTNGQGKGKNK